MSEEQSKPFLLECFETKRLTPSDQHVYLTCDVTEAPGVYGEFSPCLLNNASTAKFLPVRYNHASDWPGLNESAYKYIRVKIGQKDIELSLSSKSDCDVDEVSNGYNVERRVKLILTYLLDILENKTQDGIFNVRQGHSIVKQEILDSSQGCVLWPSEAFLHHQYYENVRCMIVQNKRFLILPPVAFGRTGHLSSYLENPHDISDARTLDDNECSKDVGLAQWDVEYTDLSPNLQHHLPEIDGIGFIYLCNEQPEVSLHEWPTLATHHPLTHLGLTDLETESNSFATPDSHHEALLADTTCTSCITSHSSNAVVQTDLVTNHSCDNSVQLNHDVKHAALSYPSSESSVLDSPHSPIPSYADYSTNDAQLDDTRTCKFSQTSVVSDSAAGTELLESDIYIDDANNETNFSLWKQKLEGNEDVLDSTADNLERLQLEIKEYMRHLGVEEDQQADHSLYNTQKKANATSSMSRKEGRKYSRPRLKHKNHRNVFFRFCAEQRQPMLDKHRDLDNAKISQLLRKMWNSMSSIDKEPYVLKFYEELKQMREEHPEWDHLGNKAISHTTKPRPHTKGEGVDLKKDELSIQEQNRENSKNVLEQEQCVEDLKRVLCSRCGKWRELPGEVDLEDLPLKWNCSLHPDPKFNTCDAEERSHGSPFQTMTAKKRIVGRQNNSHYSKSVRNTSGVGCKAKKSHHPQTVKNFKNRKKAKQSGFSEAQAESAAISICNSKEKITDTQASSGDSEVPSSIHDYSCSEGNGNQDTCESADVDNLTDVDQWRRQLERRIEIMHSTLTNSIKGCKSKFKRPNKNKDDFTNCKKMLKVQCRKCNKWRNIPASIYMQISETWTCCVVPDVGHTRQISNLQQAEKKALACRQPSKLQLMKKIKPATKLHVDNKLTIKQTSVLSGRNNGEEKIMGTSYCVEEEDCSKVINQKTDNIWESSPFIISSDGNFNGTTASPSQLSGISKKLILHSASEADFIDQPANKNFTDNKVCVTDTPPENNSEHVDNFVQREENKPLKRKCNREDESKRQTTPFLQFCAGLRELVTETSTDCSSVEIDVLLERMWQGMTPEEKEPYNVMVKADVHAKRPNKADNSGKQRDKEVGKVADKKLRTQALERKRSFKQSCNSKCKRDLSKPNQERNCSKKIKGDRWQNQEVSWAQCDECNKWRKLPPTVDAQSLPKKWNCSLNPDRQHNRCDAEEEVVTDLWNYHVINNSDDDSVDFVDVEHITCDEELLRVDAAGAARSNAFVKNFQNRGIGKKLSLVKRKRSYPKKTMKCSKHAPVTLFHNSSGNGLQKPIHKKTMRSNDSSKGVDAFQNDYIPQRTDAEINAELLKYIDMRIKKQRKKQKMHHSKRLKKMLSHKADIALNMLKVQNHVPHDNDIKDSSCLHKEPKNKKPILSAVVDSNDSLEREQIFVEKSVMQHAVQRTCALTPDDLLCHEVIPESFDCKKLPEPSVNEKEDKHITVGHPTTTDENDSASYPKQVDDKSPTTNVVMKTSDFNELLHCAIQNKHLVTNWNQEFISSSNLKPQLGLLKMQLLQQKKNRLQWSVTKVQKKVCHIKATNESNLFDKVLIREASIVQENQNEGSQLEVKDQDSVQQPTGKCIASTYSSGRNKDSNLIEVNNKQNMLTFGESNLPYSAGPVNKSDCHSQSAASPVKNRCTKKALKSNSGCSSTECNNHSQVDTNARFSQLLQRFYLERGLRKCIKCKKYGSISKPVIKTQLTDNWVCSVCDPNVCFNGSEQIGLQDDAKEELLTPLPVVDSISQLSKELEVTSAKDMTDCELAVNKDKDVEMEGELQHYGTKVKNKKKRRKILDESKLRRPMNAFLKFSRENRELVSELFPNNDNRSVSILLGRLWRKLLPEEKEPYIVAFQEEMNKMRAEHPDWNYSGKAQNKTDLSEVKVQRLRTRTLEQFLGYRDCLKRRYTKKHRRSTKIYPNQGELVQKTGDMLANTEELLQDKEDVWVQCDECNKWRKLTPTAESQNLPEKWNCTMNLNQERNFCDAEEEEW